MLPDKINLSIVTPDQQIVSRTVDEVVLPSLNGYMGVRPGHTPLLARLDIGEVSYRADGQECHLAVSGGFAEVLREGVEILAQTCEPADAIDLDRAQSSKDRAEERMKTSDSDFERAKVSLARALCRIRIHGRAKS